jgi:hypothetical protein
VSFGKWILADSRFTPILQASLRPEDAPRLGVDQLGAHAHAVAPSPSPGRERVAFDNGSTTPGFTGGVVVAAAN